MLVFGVGSPIEITLPVFQVLMTFSEAITIREAFSTMDVDVDLDEFCRIVATLIDHGLLWREPPVDETLDLRKLLNPRVLGSNGGEKELSAWMRQGKAILIPNALDEELAEAAHRDLQAADRWIISTGEHDFFHYRNLVLERLEERSLALSRCRQLFGSRPTRRFIEELSSEDCSGDTNVSASWYRPGEYALPHDDSSTGDPRSVAFIWYLTKHWRREWGGSLFWCPTGQYICPSFNSLLMFRVIPSNMHLVCPVSPNATQKRLAINGFWHRGSQTPRAAPTMSDSFVSPQAYGPSATTPLDLTSAIIL